nr:polysaccharide pyruvyl transferase family protein [Wenzhouxiangella sp. XN201]
MEFGNIGNYYIIEPFFRELKRTFPTASVKTTLQMSKRFCIAEQITVLPMELYFGWTETDLQIARREASIANKYHQTGHIEDTTPYLEALHWADMVIDFSGDIWGDNANLISPDRFEVGLLKDQTAQLMNKKTAMLAGSPGPFGDEKLKNLAKRVYASFDLVTNREPLSTKLLHDEGFDCSRTRTTACPAFIFNPAKKDKVEKIVKGLQNTNDDNQAPIVGFTICGWNFEEGPFDKWPRQDEDYQTFVESIEHLDAVLGAKVCLFSHSNGFDPPPSTFELKHGRDYPIIKTLQKILRRRGIAKNVITLDGIYSAWDTKAIIGSMDMLVSGRVHAAVAAISQHVPTVIIDYGHEPKAHKLRGFAMVAGVEDYLADPSSPNDIKTKIQDCWRNVIEYREFLEFHIPAVKKQAELNFELLKRL